MNPDLPVLHCTLRRAHAQHDWWGRKMQLYFHCPGRTVSLVRKSRSTKVNEARSLRDL
jgi:hypothetical protein